MDNKRTNKSMSQPSGGKGYLFRTVADERKGMFPQRKPNQKGKKDHHGKHKKTRKQPARTVMIYHHQDENGDLDDEEIGVDQKHESSSPRRDSLEMITNRAKVFDLHAEQEKEKKKKKEAKLWNQADNPLFVGQHVAEEEKEIPFYLWIYTATFHFLWPPLNYFRIYLLYISLVALFGSIILYLAEIGNDAQSLSYTDAFYITVSAVTQTGLSPVDLSKVTTFGQVVIIIVVVLGNAVLLTVAPVVVRLYYFITRIKGRKLNKRRSMEYLALWRLLVIVPIYYVFTVGMAWFLLGVYTTADSTANAVIKRNATNPTWWSLFHALSAFGNAGFSIFPDNLFQWRQQPFPLFVIAAEILLGNTAFPVMMRVIVWVLYKQPLYRRHRAVYKYMLEHPRRCFTHMFPAAETRYLVIVIIFLNAVQFFSTLILDWYSAAFAGMDAWRILVNAFFQTISTRTAGFNSINIAEFDAGMLWLYVIMMYIAASPVFITVRYTDVPEEITGGPEDEEEEELLGSNTIGSQATRVVMQHIFFIFAAMFAIFIIEAVSLQYDPNFSMFAVIFEVISAYGCVGLSLGYGSAVWSFSGSWKHLSKLILAAIMLLGRHRGLPDSIDKAITISVTDKDFADSDDEESDSSYTKKKKNKKKMNKTDKKENGKHGSIFSKLGLTRRNTDKNENKNKKQKDMNKNNKNKNKSKKKNKNGGSKGEYSSSSSSSSDMEKSESDLGTTTDSLQTDEEVANKPKGYKRTYNFDWDKIKYNFSSSDDSGEEVDEEAGEGGGEDTKRNKKQNKHSSVGRSGSDKNDNVEMKTLATTTKSQNES